MRYILLSYVSGGEGMLYQIHDAAGNFLRFADMDGNTINAEATLFSATMIAADVDPPAWHVPVDPPAPEQPVVPVPETITKRQFLIQLLRSGMATTEEAATLALQPPAAILAVFAQLPTEAALEAQLTWASMTIVERSSPINAMAVAAGVVTEEQLDDFFRAASVI